MTTEPAPAAARTPGRSETDSRIPAPVSVQAVQPLSISRFAPGGLAGAPRIPMSPPTTSSSSAVWAMIVGLTSAPRMSLAEVMLMTGRTTMGRSSSVMT